LHVFPFKISKSCLKRLLVILTQLRFNFSTAGTTFLWAVRWASRFSVRQQYCVKPTQFHSDSGEVL